MKKEHLNPFENKTTEELIKLYEQFLESEKTAIIPDNELGKIRDIYLEDFGSGQAIYMLQFELTHTLSDLWYKEKCKEDESNSKQYPREKGMLTLDEINQLYIDYSSNYGDSVQEKMVAEEIREFMSWITHAAVSGKRL